MQFCLPAMLRVLLAKSHPTRQFVPWCFRLCRSADHLLFGLLLLFLNVSR
ncbi:hypothetical protein J2Z75_003290 [Rhizobium herbae]|uniref:Uncharacterized protein n=1 Tax=Rhizobium herbae TaxID=508661 RepID=A0ABS4EPC1_9HYPH|nr:hypothetical protein [Rhizobium herbae]